MSALVAPFLTPNECDAIVAIFPSDVVAGGATRGASRRSRVAFAPPGNVLAVVLASLLRDRLRRANDEHFHFDLSGEIEPPQFAIYSVGDHYGPHLDLGPGSHALRKLSVSVQLSDTSDYDGGDLELWGTGKADRARGAIIIFPSYLVHEVKPVTRGVRRSLVAWAVGDRPFR